MSAVECTVPYRSGFCIGLGVSSFTGEAAVRPWAFPDKARPQLNTGFTDEGAQPRTIHFEEGFIDRQDHYEAAIKASASLNVKGWGTVSPQGSLDVLYDMQLDSRTQHYVVIARFETATYNVLATSTYQPELSQRAAADLQSKGPRWWAEQYGSHFVAGYVVGGHMVGIASITSQNSQHALEVKANLQAKFGCGWLGKAKGSFEGKGNMSMTGCEVKTKYHCAGALTLEVDTSDIFALRKAAQLHMKEGVGLKCQAILWLFSHLEGYNNAEALYQGAPELLTWQYDPVAVVRILNLEHARLQRLQKTIDAHSISEDKDSYQAICLLVKGAMKALYKIQVCTDLVKVDESHEGFDEELHRDIFVAEQAESMLQAHTKLLLEQQQVTFDTQEADVNSRLDQMPALAALLRSSEAEQAASELLRLAKAGEESRRAIMAAGSLPALVALLSSARFVIQQQAAAVVEALAADSLQVSESISRSGVLPPIIALLSSAQPVVQEHAAAALAALLDASQQNRDASIAAYALLPLLQMLESKHSAAQEHACTALRHLFCGNRETQDAVVAAVVARGRLQSLLTSQCSLAMVLSNLSNIATGSGQGPDIRERTIAAAANIFPIVVQWLRTPKMLVRLTADEVLVYMGNWTGVGSIVAARFAPMLVAMLESDDIMAQDQAADIVTTMADRAGEHTDMAFIAAGIPSILIRCFQHHSKQRGTSAYCWLAKICDCAPWHDALIAAGVFQLLGTIATEPYADLNAAVAVSCLCERETSPAVAHQALPVLLSCLQSEDLFVHDMVLNLLKRFVRLKLFSKAVMSSLRAKHVC